MNKNKTEDYIAIFRNNVTNMLLIYVSKRELQLNSAVPIVSELLMINVYMFFPVLLIYIDFI